MQSIILVMKIPKKQYIFICLLTLLSTLFFTCRKPQPAQQERLSPDTEKQTTLKEADLEPLPDGFCLLTDSIPDAILEIRYYSDNNFVGTRIDGYEEPVALITQKAASALRKASDEFRKKGYSIKIYDAYRPQRAVDHFVQWSKDLADTAMKSVFYPHIQKTTIFSRGYVARKSKHSRGSTVDMTLVDLKTGKEVDMGGSFDYFGNISRTMSESITAEQHQNRLLLRNIMVANGFYPVQGEWWHFTLCNEPYPNTYFDFPVKMYR